MSRNHHCPEHPLRHNVAIVAPTSFIVVPASSLVLPEVLAVRLREYAYGADERAVTLRDFIGRDPHDILWHLSYTSYRSDCTEEKRINNQAGTKLQNA